MDGTFLSYENELNILIDTLTKTLLSFENLSREQTESAILETSIKIKEGEILIAKMEKNLLNCNKNTLIIRTNEEMNEIKNKIKNYKIEFTIISHKFELLQSTYISQKTEEVEIDDNIRPSKDILIEKEIIQNLNKKLNNDQIKNRNNIENNVVYQRNNDLNRNDFNVNVVQNNIFLNNIGNISGVNNVNQNDIIAENLLNNLKIAFNNKKRKFILLLVGIITLVIISILLVISVKSI